MTYIRPPQVTEREVSHLWVDERSMDDAAWEDCGPCTALECVIASGYSAPPTHYEEESLRMDAGYGPLGGTDVPHLAAGIAKRYGITIGQVGGLSDLPSALTPGLAAFAIVAPAKLPSSHVLRKYVGTGFARLHFIYLANEGAAAPWMLDPAAPSGYLGNPLSWSDLALCYVGGAGIVKLALEENMAGLKFTLPDAPVSGTVAVALGTPVIRVSDNAQVKLGGAVSGRAAYMVLSLPGSRMLIFEAGSPLEAHAVYFSEATFTPASGPQATTLTPGYYEVR